MTTVIIDCGSKKIVADKQTTVTLEISRFSLTKMLFGSNGCGKPTGEEIHDYKSCTKIHKLNEEVYATECGDANLTKEFISAYKNFNSVPKLNSSSRKGQICIVRASGEGLLVDIYSTSTKKCLFGEKPYWKHQRVKSESKCITMGSGGDYAFGALMAGVSPEEALIAASKADDYTSSHYDVVEL